MNPTNGIVKLNIQNLFKEFLQRSYISGLYILLLYTPVRYAKALWVVTLTIVVISTHVVIIDLTLDYIGQPTEIHMSPNLVHVANSPFPAIGVCSANKISKRKLEEYASKVFQHQEAQLMQPAAQNANEMSQRLLVLAFFFLNVFDEPDLDAKELKRLHNVLFSFYNNSMYPIRDILGTLAPDCEHFVPRGIIYGQPVNTSRLFLRRSTSTSICCIFNYRRPKYSRDPVFSRTNKSAEEQLAQAPEVKFESNSILNSVQFVLQDESMEDFTYTYLSNTAFQVIVFPQNDYAAIQSSSVGELLVDYNSIVEIAIQPKFFASRHSVRQVTAEKRLCYFPDEGKKIVNLSNYSLDECLLICRIQSMVQHCGCASATMAASYQNVSYCTLPDLPCLMKWTRIWHGFDLFAYVKPDQQDVASFKLCGHCLPSCNGVNFKIYTNISPLRLEYSKKGYGHGLLTGLTNERPLAIIKLFFKQRYAHETEVNLVGDWVVLLNRFGGILSLMYGFSIISYIEILYYLTGKWFVLLYRTLNASGRQMCEQSIGTQPARQLYWNELKPKHSFVSENSIITGS